jgi:CrcB protein
MSGVLLWVGVGVLGGLAALARVLVDEVVAARITEHLPVGTLAVNLSGSLVLGVLAGVGVAGDAYLLTGTAVLGSYTTFSTWMLESRTLAGEGRDGLLAAAVNIALSLVAGVGAVAVGRAIAGG